MAFLLPTACEAAATQNQKRYGKSLHFFMHKNRANVRKKSQALLYNPLFFGEMKNISKKTAKNTPRNQEKLILLSSVKLK
jgi:hypothetical protein